MSNRSPLDVKAIARAMFAAMDAEGFAGCLPFLAPSATWWSASAGDIPLSSIPAISAAMASHMNGGMRLTMVDVIAEGNKVAAEFTTYADMKSGSTYENKSEVLAQEQILPCTNSSPAHCPRLADVCGGCRYHYKLVFDSGGKVIELREYMDTRVSAEVWHPLLGIKRSGWLHRLAHRIALLTPVDDCVTFTNTRT